MQEKDNPPEQLQSGGKKRARDVSCNAMPLCADDANVELGRGGRAGQPGAYAAEECLWHSDTEEA
jgi:hypothetical protein